MLKELIRLNIKPNYADLGRKYEYDNRIAKSRYNEETIKKMELK